MKEYKIELILLFLVLVIFYNILKNDIFNGYFVSFIFPIVLTSFFTWIIIYSNNKIAIDQRNFEIRKKEYDLIMGKLDEVANLLSFLDEMSYVEKQNKDLKAFYELYLKNYSLKTDLIMKSFTNSITYFPELYTLNHLIIFYFKNWIASILSQSPDKTTDETEIDIGKRILKQILLIKKEVIGKEFRGDYKNKKQQNKDYFEKVEKKLYRAKDNILLDIEKYKYNFNTFKLLTSRELIILKKGKNLTIPNKELEILKENFRHLYGYNDFYWFPDFKEKLNIKNEDTKFFK